MRQVWTIVLIASSALWCASVAQAQDQPPPRGEAPELLAQATPVRPIQPLPRGRRPAARPGVRPNAKRPQRPARRRVGGSSLTVPLNIGVAPTANFMTGPIQSDQLIHTGLRFYVAAVIDQELIRQNLDRVPPAYRAQASRMKEVRYVPSAFIPHSVIISPKTRDTGMYGIAFRPLALGLALTPPPVRVGFDVGLMAKYMYMHSDTLDAPMHFLRPGLEARLDVEFALSKSFLMSVGWASQVYIPQEVGGPIFAIGDLNNSLWHIGQAYLMLHFRVPYTHQM